MEQVDFLGKGWGYPITFQDGKLNIADGESSIRQSIMIILSTAKGERVMRPDFGCGIQELVFAPNNTATTTLVAFHVKEALMKWEPRIDILNVKAAPDEDQPNRLNIEIEYLIKSNNTKANLVYPFYLEKAGK